MIAVDYTAGEDLMAATALISLREYLEGPVPQPDVEYLDGILKERSVVFSVHGLLQVRIGIWFHAHSEWNLKAAVEVRTQVSPSHVRLPDVVVGPRRKWPQVLVEPPLIVIEILSPSDSYTEVRRMAREYHAMGVQNIWLIDPDTRTAEFFQAGNWIAATRLQVAGSPIYLDISEIFAELDRDNQEAD